jgi:hypothetical protein
MMPLGQIGRRKPKVQSRDEDAVRSTIRFPPSYRLAHGIYLASTNESSTASTIARGCVTRTLHERGPAGVEGRNDSAAR